MDEKTFKLISKLDHEFLTLEAAKKLPEPTRTEKLLEIMRRRLSGASYFSAIEIVEFIYGEQKEKALEIILDYMVANGHFKDAIKAATCLDRSLTINELTKILEIQISLKRGADAQETARFILKNDI